MARLFPNKPVGSVRPEIARVLHALKRTAGDELMVWIALPLGSEWRPSLMSIYREESCHLIAVSSLSEAQAETLLHGDLFAGAAEAPTPGDLERETRERLRGFRASALAGAGVDHDAVNLPVISVLAFPNVPQAMLDEFADRGAIRDCELWGRETIRAEMLLQRIESAREGRSFLPKAVLDALREKFSPEIGIPEMLVTRVQEKPECGFGPKLTGFLLDLDQEYLAKEDLTFSVEADAALHDMKARLVTGVAGSGKSLILLYRAMLQARLNPDASILILTHNRPLNGELRERFRRLCPASGARWTTFYQWCREFSGVAWEIAKPWVAEEILRGVVSEDSSLTRLPLSFLSGEIDWMRDHAISSRDEYMNAQRTGRKRPLQDDQRQAVYSLLERYRAALDRQGLEDWPGAAAAVWRRIQDKRIKPPMYDFIFVDEAQFFAPSWFHIVKSALRPDAGQLFLAADPTQGFLKRRQSWAASGLDVRGHSARLRRCYRNTREILEFAAAFYKRRLPEDEEEINLPGPDDAAAMASGEAPQFFPVESSQSERSRVANEIAAALRRGAKPESFLVILNDSGLVTPFIETLDRTLGYSAGRDLKDLSYSTGGVRVTSLNASTGLESPIVFLCGLDGLLEKEDALGLAENERSELLRDNTRRIYMAMTRASKKLIITYGRASTKDCLGGGSVAASADPLSAAPALEIRKRYIRVRYGS